ncbi:disease resistance protein [Trifolium medium]|uniref:Disease resistance protein n=1 Tax=Trifolium medium TaxID=97028 RepID=A0A392NQK7_9FABA|nr:disease resistance protein [Trifolium medium]
MCKEEMKVLMYMFCKLVLDACGFGATSGIQILEDKALVTISSNRIQMHDLLQKMALDIVRNDQGKRSRLRDIEDVRDLLKSNKGADVVEGMLFDLSQKRISLNVKPETFNMMVDLRFLKLYVPLGMKRLTTLSHSDQGIMQFSDKLRYLESVSGMGTL